MKFSSITLDVFIMSLVIAILIHDIHKIVLHRSIASAHLASFFFSLSFNSAINNNITLSSID